MPSSCLKLSSFRFGANYYVISSDKYPIDESQIRNLNDMGWQETLFAAPQKKEDFTDFLCSKEKRSVRWLESISMFNYVTKARLNSNKLLEKSSRTETFLPKDTLVDLQERKICIPSRCSVENSTLQLNVMTLLASRAHT